MGPGDDPRTDQELIEAANCGDRTALSALYYRYRDWIYSLAIRFGSDHHDACDVLQETFVYFLGKFPGFELRCQLKTFLYPAVRNLSIKRGQRRRRDSSIDEMYEEPIAQVQRDEDRERCAIQHMVKTLPEGQREVVLLRFADDLDLSEIAQALDIPLGTVKSRLHNALKTLRTHLSS